MLFRRKTCEFCKNTIPKGKELKEEVEVFGRVGKWNMSFCSGKCIDLYRKRTEKLMQTRRPNICTKCLR